MRRSYRHITERADLSILDEVSCHCEVDPDGHQPGEGGCTVVIKKGRAASSVLCRRDHGLQVGTCPCQGAAKGTCPDCGRAGVTVRKVVVTGELPRVGGAVPLGVVPALAAHRLPYGPGAQCSGAGKVPAETSYTPPRRVADWASEYGPEYVDLHGAVLELPAKRQVAS